MKLLLLAFQFLTIIPIHGTTEVTERDMTGSAIWFPVVGALQGFMVAFIAFFSLKFFSPEIAAGLALLTLVISNGGFHLDGLADTFDALAVKSVGDYAENVRRRLAAMKDSSTGAIGVTAIVFAVLLKYLFFSHLLSNHYPLVSCSIIFLMPVFSKWLFVPAMYHGKSAKKDGLGRIFIGSVNQKMVMLSTLFLLFFSAGPLILSVNKGDFILFPFMFISLYAVMLYWIRCCAERFGGLTGDTLGALSEISENLYLMVTIAWLRHSI